MNPIDKILNNVTMYRLVVWVLLTYVVAGIGLAFMGRLSATPTQMVVSLALVLTSAYLTDRGLGRLYKVPTNMETSLITSLILFLILQSAHSLSSGLALVLAGVISSASKFVIAWNGKHIFNPAALAASVLSLTGLGVTIWWIGSSLLWPLTLVLGLTVAYKIRRVPLVISFGVVAIITQYFVILHAHQAVGSSLHGALLASPLIFLGTIMLTEPATMPPRRTQQIIFGALVGVLYAGSWKLGPLTIYPEVALLLGNMYAYVVSPKFRVQLTLKEVQRISDRVYNYTFKPEHAFTFLPGQYMEWTLAGVPYDSRGNRRTFTIASSPTEPTVQLGIKYYEPASMYKAQLMDMKPGATMYASQLSGNFTLKGNEGKKLAFVAGGIGITPFRSMIKYLSDTKAQADVVLLYIVGDPHEFAYLQEFKEAAAAGIKTIPIVTNLDYQAPGVVTTKINAESLSKLLPDYKERTFYISGPNAMVDGTKGYLRQLGVPRQRIKTDHFSGY